MYKDKAVIHPIQAIFHRDSCHVVLLDQAFIKNEQYFNGV